MSNKIQIAVAKGDGIGPEIMNAVLQILKAADAPAEFQEVEMGKAVFEAGHSSGMTPESKEIVENTGILLKGPMETPKGKGVKSINVTARKVWNTYANVRRFKTLKGVDTVFSQADVDVDMTVVRENIEDTYSGIEYQPSPDIATGQRMISKAGSEQLFRYSFELARQEGMKRIVCGHKSNIMKLTDGLFMETFYEVAKDYPDIDATDAIVDDLAMKLVMYPQRYEMIVLPNLQGDILSDLCAGMVGGLGFAPSANIGDKISIFEAVHGTAPDIAGKKLANPTALLMSSLMMLRRIGAPEAADNIENSLIFCLEKGIHTADFGAAETKPVNTEQFAEKIIDNLGKKPTNSLPKDTPKQEKPFEKPPKPSKPTLHTYPVPKDIVTEGVDIFTIYQGLADDLVNEFNAIVPETLEIQSVSNRGTQVWPESSVFTECVPHYRLRFLLKKPGENLDTIYDLIRKTGEKFDITEVQWLKRIEGKRSYALAQGQ